VRRVWLRGREEMARFDSAIALAKKLITKNGQAVILRNFNEIPGAPDKPWKPGGNVPTDQTVQAVFLNYKQDYIDGTLIQEGDQQVFIPADGLTEAPQLNGQIIRNGEEWKIMNVKPLSPNGQLIMYELQVS